MQSKSSSFLRSRRFWKRLVSPVLGNKGPLIPVLRLSGVIGPQTPLRQGLSLAAYAAAIERAFSFEKAPAIALQINSPGGSPVQSRLIFERIRTLADETSKKVYVFAEDVAASGGYLVALAGDEIYADASSIIGSIGVVTSGFGFVDLLNKLGIERRVYTSGSNKSQLDPFQPEKEEDVARLKSLQHIIHEDFIALVKERRAGHLSKHELDLFTGEFWTGRQALELGLIDGIMDLRTKMKAVYGDDVRLKLISQERSFLRPKTGVLVQSSHVVQPSAVEVNLFAGLVSAVEERMSWARFGL